MKLQKVLGGALFVVFFLFFSQTMRFFLQDQSFFSCNALGGWNVPLPMPLLFLFGLPFLFAVLCLAVFSQKSLETFGWLLLLSGGASNLFERSLYGCIGDYIELPLLPLLNPADLFLTAGVILLAVSLLKERHFSKKT